MYIYIYISRAHWLNIFVNAQLSQQHAKRTNFDQPCLN